MPTCLAAPTLGHPAPTLGHPAPTLGPQLPEFEQRVRVLQRLGYLADDRSVTLKGRACCEIQSTQAGRGASRQPAHTACLAAARCSRIPTLHPQHRRSYPPLGSRPLAPPLFPLRSLHARMAPPPQCPPLMKDELVATEAVFCGLLGELAPEEAVALLSALVFQVGGCLGGRQGRCEWPHTAPLPPSLYCRRSLRWSRGCLPRWRPRGRRWWA